jgi:threonine 3-dehydrogenase
MGIEHVIDISKHNIPDIQKELGMKEGFDVGMEMSGNPHALRGLIASMTHGGKIAILGIPGEDTAIDWNTLIFNMLTIKGIYGRQMYETWYMMSIMVQNGLDVMPIITHRYHYTDFQKGFDVMNSGNAGKVVLSWKD